MNLDIDRIIDFYLNNYGVLYWLGLDEILACFWWPSLNKYPSEPNDINKLWFVQISGAYSCIKLWLPLILTKFSVHLKLVHWMTCIQKRFKMQRWRNVLCRCCPLLNFLSRWIVFKNVSFRSTSRVSNSMNPDNAWHFSLIWVQAVDKVKQANSRFCWIKIWRLIAFENNSTTLKLRICVFSQFVTFKFNVDPLLALPDRLPNLLELFL